jgi:hypothetical protein
MFIRVLLVLLLIFSFVSCYGSNSGKKPAKAPAEAKTVDPFTLDFGRIKQGEVVKHGFTLKNDSATVLNIKSVNTSCGCTISKSQKNKLEPGESTVIEVSFNSKGYSGPVTQYVYVNTDSADNPLVRFTIKAEVVK